MSKKRQYQKDSETQPTKTEKFSRKGSSNGRNNKRYSGGRSTNKDREYVEKSTNDPAWYSQSPELLRDAASIPFSWPVGTNMHTSQIMASDVVPGICAIKVEPTVGTSLNQNSPVNVAASAIYSWVRHANSGHANYEAADLMMYLLAMSNIYSLIVWMQRLYGYITMFDQRNRYLPEQLAFAENISYGDFRNNLANFRYFLNTYISKVASLAVPNTMPIFNRLAFLYSNIYSEGPSIKDQLYMYSPNNLAWYKFQLNDQTGVGELVLTPMYTGTAISFAAMRIYARELFDAIWSQEDFGIMSGDIIKAYDGNVIKLSMVPEEMSMTPIYDAMVLHQMKNAKLGSYVKVNKISQNDGLISQALIMDTDADPLLQAIMFKDGLANKILSSDFDNPGPEVVIESTRLMIAYDEYAGVFHGGTEIVKQVEYYHFANDGVGKGTILRNATCNYTTTVAKTPENVAEMAKAFSLMSNFKYHPEHIIHGVNENNTVPNNASYRVWDIDNYAVLSNDDLIKMHETALLSLFAVPAIAKIQ